MQLDIHKIRIDGGTQPRAELLIEVMEDYAEQMRNGEKFPPITVFFDGTEYWLADGFHREGAHLRAFGEDTPIEAEVVQGTQSDAQWYSYGANKAHGLRRTNPDKERAVRTALQHPKAVGKSNYQIADHCGVSEFMIRKHRKASLSDEPKSGEDDSVTTIISQSDDDDAATTIISQSDDDGAATTIISQSDDQNERSPSPKRGRFRTGRDGRTINTAKIGEGTAKRNGKRRVTVYSSTQAREVAEQGQRFRFGNFVKLELPTNHAANCAFDLLRFLPFTYLEKVFQEIVRLHEERLEKESSQ